jgi:hypothetical protein
MLTGHNGAAMPDEHGLLSKADNDSIQRWWDQHWKEPVICPVCKTTDWSLSSHFVNIQRFATDANASNTPTYPPARSWTGIHNGCAPVAAVNPPVWATRPAIVWRSVAGALAGFAASILFLD